ncbi:hypothetical protein IAG44_39215 [Streptomyces roseirectus]|uniref:Integrase catalytic domain-containing protein n=1 Tax=Streptomyces roseirectus TaxID=2768066 RepID=A0A7H0IQ04_9ACTN|nr:hypothetical protein [Streptomyces roseirectus]QNP74870.1 hypothetical protein IAG44_39215 [Streptomyces roseirectus]
MSEASRSVLKVEYVHRRAFRTRAEARVEIATWITGFCNTSVYGFRSPIDCDRVARSPGPRLTRGPRRPDHPHVDTACPTGWEAAGPGFSGRPFLDGRTVTKGSPTVSCRTAEASHPRHAYLACPPR